MRNLFLLLFAALVVAFIFGDDGEISHPPEILVAEEPRQTDLYGEKPFDFKSCRITPLAEFSVRARVLSKEGYWFDRGSRISPLDLALGWGRMSDQAILGRLSISQSGRWYTYRPRNDQFPIPVEEIVAQSANMHLIPSTTAIERTLKSARRGNIVDLTGYLVAVESGDGSRWRSSLSRTDSGGGSCELVWVRSAVVR